MLPLAASNGTSGLPIGDNKDANNLHSRENNLSTVENTSMRQVEPSNKYYKIENATILNNISRKEVSTTVGNTIDKRALSSSLASFARTAEDVSNSNKDEDEGAVEVDSSSSSGDQATTREALNASDRDSSSTNSSGSRNVVTASQTTSSGDDRDSGTASGGSISGGITSKYSGLGRELGRHHHHHHQRSRRRIHTNDGSVLQVPGDDGSDRLAGGPATVEASRLYPPHSDTTTNASSSGSGGEGEMQHSLLQPHREPGYNTVSRTFSKLPRRDAKRDPKSSATDSASAEEGTTKKLKGKHGLSKPSTDVSPKAKEKKPRARAEDPKTRKKAPAHARGRGSPSPDSVNSIPPDGDGGGSSSGSGTEGGYAGSASSNEISGQQESCSSSSVSSSEDSRRKSKSKRRRVLKDGGRQKSSKQEGGGSGDASSSSEIAYFSSGNSDYGENAGGFTIKKSPVSPLTSSSNGLEETYTRAKGAALEEAESWTHRRMPAAATATKVTPAPWPRPRIRVKDNTKLDGCTPILNMGPDSMAHVLTFLQPPEILDVLTMPLSKAWRQNFTSQPELWRVLCLVEPFKARIEDGDEDDSSSGDSFYSPTQSDDGIDKRLLDRYRLMYTSFVRCMKYLSQIREDAINGRPPSYIDYGVAGGNGGTQSMDGTNQSLRSFLARARGVVAKSKRKSESIESSESLVQESQPVANILTAVGRARKRKRTGNIKETDTGLSIGTATLTDVLLGPSPSGQAGDLNLSWSSAIYSIVNWMAAFSDVEGIQTLCMKVLPFLLEDEQQRITAQKAGLTDVVLRGMVKFANSVQLHIAAFHTIVLLARPLGGKEGMLFHSSIVASGIFGGENSQHRKNDIAVMLDSMRRFEDNDVLQGMGCWALVNIALAPAQKAVLMKLGGIQATTNAMLRHPFSAEVQFRGLFALINLVIPSVRLNGDSREAVAVQEQPGEVNDTTEKEIIDELVGDIASLVVRALKTFCSSEAILNRACLVLHNLSLTQEYHTTLLWTPNCYQMLEWCLINCHSDQVLIQSATLTLHRLQMTLSNDDDLRNRFAKSFQSQQQTALKEAHREAIRLHEQEEELQRAEQQ